MSSPEDENTLAQNTCNCCLSAQTRARQASELIPHRARLRKQRSGDTLFCPPLLCGDEVGGEEGTGNLLASQLLTGPSSHALLIPTH